MLLYRTVFYRVVSQAKCVVRGRLGGVQQLRSALRSIDPVGDGKLDREDFRLVWFVRGGGAGGRGCVLIGDHRIMHVYSLQDHRSSRPCYAGMEHVGFSLTRQTFMAERGVNEGLFYFRVPGTRY